MSKVECPTCSEPTAIALPSDATVNKIANEPPEDIEESSLQRIGQVSCSCKHDIYVVFMVTTGDDYDPFY